VDDAAPRKFRNMDEALDPAQVHEDAKVGDIGDRASDVLPRHNGVEEHGALARLSQSGTFLEDHTSVLGDTFDDLEV